MSYLEIGTSALILAQHNLNEEAVGLDILTSELGRLTVTADGVRKLSSKLRYALVPYSLSTVYLVYGRSGWRLINAENKSNLYYQKDLFDRKVIIRLVELLRRVVPPGEPHHWIEDFINYLDSSPEKLSDQYLAIAALILSKLGYLPAQETFPEVFAKPQSLSPENRQQLSKVIKLALSNSHL